MVQDRERKFIIPSVLGNIVGGGVLVALLNHGQVAADRASKEKSEREED